GAARGSRCRRRRGCSSGASRPRLEERELRAVADGRHDERAVEVTVEALAGGLGHVEAAVAGRALGAPVARVARGVVRGADGVVRAEAAEVPRLAEVPPN